MSKFTETVTQETPRLVVMFQRDGENEMFSWGIVGKIPLLSLIGAIVETQVELFVVEWAEKCPESSLVIAYDEATRKFQWFIGPDIPTHPLVGMLDTIRITLATTHVARQQAAQQVVLGLDGRPFRR